MGKGGGGAQTVTQTTLPEYAQPFVEDLFARAETESQRPYEAYGGQRIAGPSGTTLAGRDIATNLGSGITGLPQAQQAVGSALQASQTGMGSINSPFSQYQYGPAGTYTAQNVQQYMSPYMQNVVDVQKQQAILDFNRAQAGRDAQAVQAGAFGGSRQAVVDALAQEALGRQLGDIQATGQQQAFEQGAGMFEQDRQARMALDQARQQDLARVQSGQMSVEQFNRQYGMDLTSQTGALAGQLAGLGEAERAAALQQAGVMQDIGAQETAEQQALLSQDYQDFLRQQQYGREQLQFYGDILRGNIRQGDIATMQYAQANPYQQLLGGGLAALGMYGSGGFGG